jgi:hypothetical protein
VGLGFYTQEVSHGGLWVAVALVGICAMVFFMCLLGLIGALRLARQMLRLVGASVKCQGGIVCLCGSGTGSLWLVLVIVPVPSAPHGVHGSCGHALVLVCMCGRSMELRGGVERGV